MKNLPLGHVHEKLGARMAPFAGFNMPLEYSGVVNEHVSVRENAGLFDVSHMGEFWVKGEGALDFLQALTTNDLSKIAPGKAQYNLLPNGKGGVVDDLIIYHYSPDKYMLVVNAANIEKDWNWFQQHLTGNVTMENASDQMGLFALQGPRANDILQPLVDYTLHEIKSFQFITTSVAGIPDVIVSATGYTGAGGFELYFMDKNAGELWEAIMKAGKAYNLQPVGLAARDTLRVEMGYPLYGNDIDDTTSPIEANLAFAVKLREGNDFIDKDLYQEQKNNGVERKLVAFELVDRGIPRKAYPIVTIDGQEIGQVTSGTMSPMLKKGIGMGYVKTGYQEIGKLIYIQIRNRQLKAEIVHLPFVKNSV